MYNIEHFDIFSYKREVYKVNSLSTTFQVDKRFLWEEAIYSNSTQEIYYKMMKRSMP